jgi:two-component sensor histidine kinase
LQIISSLISLQSRQVEDKGMINFFNQTKNRIGSIALVHEKLYKSPDISRINFEEYLTELLKNIYDTFKTDNSNIDLKVNVEKIFISIDIAISLALIINEIASNSFKHAFPDNRKGEFHISLKKVENSKFILSLKDDGVGFSNNIPLDNTGTLGLRLVYVLVEQIGGKIIFNNSTGTEYLITF